MDYDSQKFVEPEITEENYDALQTAEQDYKFLQYIESKDENEIKEQDLVEKLISSGDLQPNMSRFVLDLNSSWINGTNKLNCFQIVEYHYYIPTKFKKRNTPTNYRSAIDIYNMDYCNKNYEIYGMDYYDKNQRDKKISISQPEKIFKSQAYFCFNFVNKTIKLENDSCVIFNRSNNNESTYDKHNNENVENNENESNNNNDKHKNNKNESKHKKSNENNKNENENNKESKHKNENENKCLATKWMRPIFNSEIENNSKQKFKRDGVFESFLNFGCVFYHDILISLVKEIIPQIVEKDPNTYTKQDMDEYVIEKNTLVDHGYLLDRKNCVLEQNYFYMLTRMNRFPISLKTAFRLYKKLNLKIGENVFYNWIIENVKFSLPDLQDLRNSPSQNLTQEFDADKITFDIIAHVWEKEIIQDFLVLIFSNHQKEILNLISDFIVEKSSFNDSYNFAFTKFLLSAL